MEARRLLLEAVSNVIFGSDNLPKITGEATFKQLFAVAKQQDLCHILAVAFNNSFTGEVKALLEKEKLLAVYRREQLDFEENRVCGLLSRANIDYMPLKGAVIKNYYPEAWLRTSSDIDILVRKADAERALELLVNAGYDFKEKGLRDYQIYSKGGVHIELHFALDANKKECNDILASVWDNSVATGNKYTMSPEFLMFYNIAHAYYHFALGGCGIKPFVDHIVLKAQLDYSRERLNALLNAGGIIDFYNGFNSLCEAWFNQGTHTDLTLQMEEYIFNGGVYGTKENLGKAQAHKKGKGRHLMSRIFKPKQELAAQYPKLEKHPILLPYYQIRRWFNLLSGDKRKNAKAEIAGNFSSSEVGKMFKELGI